MLCADQQPGFHGNVGEAAGGETHHFRLINQLSYLSSLMTLTYEFQSAAPSSSQNVPLSTMPSISHNNILLAQDSFAVIWSVDKGSRSEDGIIGAHFFYKDKTAPTTGTPSVLPNVNIKESMPCFLSPLGFHLSANIKEKIWKGEFVDIL